MIVVCVEGINGSGKSTVGRLLQEHLVAQGQHALFADPAAYGLLGQLLRSTIVRPDFKSTPELDAVLFTALRADGIARMLETARAIPDTVLVLERWSLAVHAYGAADGADESLLDRLCGFLNQLVDPDLTLILDTRAHVASERLSNLSNLNRFEIREPDFLTRVGRIYKQLALGMAPDRMLVVDSNGPGTRTFMETAAALRGLFPGLWWPGDPFVHK